MKSDYNLGKFIYQQKGATLTAKEFAEQVYFHMDRERFDDESTGDADFIEASITAMHGYTQEGGRIDFSQSLAEEEIDL